MFRLTAILFCFAGLLPSAHAADTKKFALIIAEQAYSGQVPSLSNPHNDAKLVASALSEVGFAVTTRYDLDNTHIMDEIKTYARKLGETSGDVIGFFYYTGHGISRPNDKGDYLLPINVKDLSTSETWVQSVPLSDILDEFALDSPNATNFVVFDACRSVLRLPFKATSKGFDAVTPTNGIFVAFSTSPHHTASDVGDVAGPYAQSLADAIRTPGLDDLALFQRVKENTYEKTATADDPQRPWESNGLLRLVYLNPTPVQIQPPRDQKGETPNVTDVKLVDPDPKPEIKGGVGTAYISLQGYTPAEHQADLRSIAEGKVKWGLAKIRDAEGIQQLAVRADVAVESNGLKATMFFYHDVWQYKMDMNLVLLPGADDDTFRGKSIINIGVPGHGVDSVKYFDFVGQIAKVGPNRVSIVLDRSNFTTEALNKPNEYMRFNFLLEDGRRGDLTLSHEFRFSSSNEVFGRAMNCGLMMSFAGNESS